MQQDKRFTFAKADDDNIPKGLPDDFNNEREAMPDNETDESYLDLDDSIVDRQYIVNRDYGDENYFPDSKI